MPARKKTTSPAPIILTPEQVEAQARREERNAAYLAAREDLLSRAQAIAEKLHPGRVRTALDLLVVVSEAQRWLDRANDLSGRGSE